MSDPVRRLGACSPACAALLGLALAAQAAPAPGNAKPRVHTIAIEGMAFGHAPADVRKGDVIVWVNRDIFRHTATARDDSFDVDLAPGASARTTVTRTGTMRYYCRYHPGMTGTFKVAETGR